MSFYIAGQRLPFFRAADAAAGFAAALQDMMASITPDRGNRTINLFVHSVAAAAFLPVGL